MLVRKASLHDLTKVLDLYQRVSKDNGGIARVEEEITLSYVENFMQKSLESGIQFLVFENEESIIAEIHAYKPEPKVFEHVLSELTIVVDPKFQGIGVGRMIFQAFLNEVSTHRSDILRVELIARESNVKAIQLYESLGFVIEGKFEKRIKIANHQFESDIPMAWFNPNFQQ